MKKIQGSKIFVTTIRTKGNSALVQYVDDGVLTRKYVPAAKVSDGLVSDDVLEQGIQYGYPWGEISLVFNMQKFTNELRNADVWTVDDMLRTPQKLHSALNAAFADNIRNILEFAKQEKKGVKQNDK